MQETIANHLLMRTPTGPADITRVAAFNGTIHGAGIASLTQALLDHFPGMTWEDLVFVEDATTGAVVSSLCLIPWTMRVGAATLQVGEMGIVGTARTNIENDNQESLEIGRAHV